MMERISLDNIHPDMFGMIDIYCRDNLVTIYKDSLPIGSLTSICYLAGISQDNSDQIRFNVKEILGERRLFLDDNNEGNLPNYSINY